MEKLSLDEFEEIAAAAHVTASKTVVCPPDIHRFEVYGSSGCLETEKARGRPNPAAGAAPRGGTRPRAAPPAARTRAAKKPTPGRRRCARPSSPRACRSSPGSSTCPAARTSSPRRPNRSRSRGEPALARDGPGIRAALSTTFGWPCARPHGIGARGPVDLRRSRSRRRSVSGRRRAPPDGFAPPGRPPHPRRFSHDFRGALLALRHRPVRRAAPGRSRPADPSSIFFRARREPAFGRRTTCRGARARGRGQGGLADGRPFRLELGPGVRRFRVWRPGPARISGRRGAVPRQVRPILRAGAAPRGVGGEGVGRRRRRAAIRGRGLGGRGRVRAQARARASFGAGVGCRGSSGP